MSEEEKYNENIESLIKRAKKDLNATDKQISKCNKKEKCLKELIKSLEWGEFVKGVNPKQSKKVQSPKL